MTPEKIGRFEVTGELGRGAMGIVYKGLDPQIQRPVALKVINFHKATGAEDPLQARERFMVEARATGGLSHPNILTIYEVGEEGNMAYIAMEFLEGGTLEDMVKGEKFKDYDQIFDIVRNIAEGLEEAHKKGIVHRDIKPANILMMNGRVPKIADFGLARLADSNLTTTGTVLGTPNYMAPEQIQGRKIDGRADLFALAAMFYELVTGEKPFGGESLTSVIYRVVNEEPIAPRQISLDLPPAADQFMKKALAKDPFDRFQNAREFIDALNLLQAGKTIEGISDTGKTQKLDAKELAAAAGKKKNLPVIIGGAIGALVVLILLVSMLGGGDDGKEQALVKGKTGAVENPDVPVTKIEPAKEPEKKPEAEAKQKKKSKLATASLSVISSPKGANVYINNKLVGKTPYLNRKYKQKTFTLKVAKAGYKDHVEKFKHKKKRTFRITLVPIKAKVTAKKEGKPKVAEKKKGFWGKAFDKEMARIIIIAKDGDIVEVDGKKYALEEPDSSEEEATGIISDDRNVEVIIPFGKHKVTVTRKGKSPFRKTVELKKGQRLEVKARFSR